ncbi:MAG: DUF6320 domain-containing protein [Oscillospiraceae bacterium]|nr:DUF6320 domain-containing protein [Oscillospiraceae bacterium]
MKSCKKCNVSVNGSFARCPLCQHALTPDTDSKTQDMTYPFVPLIKHKHIFLYRMLQLCSFAAVVIAIAVNYVLGGHRWSLFAVAGVACMWLGLIVGVRKRHNILKNLAYQMNIVCLLAVWWDLFTGWRGWSIDYVIPITFMSVIAATTILVRVLKVQTDDFIIYLVLLIFYGIIPSVFIVTGLCTITIPSMSCVAVSLISLAALLIFEGRNMAAELRRRFHL